MRGKKKKKKKKKPSTFFRTFLPPCIYIYPSLPQYSKKFRVRPAKRGFWVKARNQVSLF